MLTRVDLCWYSCIRIKLAIIRYQLLFEQKRDFKINVRLINQKAAMYLTFQFIDIYDVHKS